MNIFVCNIIGGACCFICKVDIVRVGLTSQMFRSISDPHFYVQQGLQLPVVF